MDFKLNDKHKQFVLSYIGDAAEAMRLAGYVGTQAELEKKGNDLLRTPAIAEAIRERSKYLASSVRMIAQTEEIQHFWSDIMRNTDPYSKPVVDKNGVTQPEENIPLPTRIKASEQLAKSQGMFIERIDVRTSVSFVELVQEAYSIPDSDLERIEIEYERNRQRKIDAEKMQKNTIEGVFEDVTPATKENLNDLF